MSYEYNQDENPARYCESEFPRFFVQVLIGLLLSVFFISLILAVDYGLDKQEERRAKQKARRGKPYMARQVAKPAPQERGIEVTRRGRTYYITIPRGHSAHLKIRE